MAAAGGDERVGWPGATDQGGVDTVPSDETRLRDVEFTAGMIAVPALTVTSRRWDWRACAPSPRRAAPQSLFLSSSLRADVAPCRRMRAGQAQGARRRRRRRPFPLRHNRRAVCQPREGSRILPALPRCGELPPGTTGNRPNFLCRSRLEKARPAAGQGYRWNHVFSWRLARADEKDRFANSRADSGLMPARIFSPASLRRFHPRRRLPLRCNAGLETVCSRPCGSRLRIQAVVVSGGTTAAAAPPIASPLRP